MKIAKNAALFSIGGGAYVSLEFLYRGYSHISMFTAGGLCFLLIGRLRRSSLPAAARAAWGAGIITAVELATGLLVNRQFEVWDYRDQPGNLFGQICPLFTLLWIPVAAAASRLYQWADRQLDRVLSPAGCAADA